MPQWRTVWAPHSIRISDPVTFAELKIHRHLAPALAGALHRLASSLTVVRRRTESVRLAIGSALGLAE
jgi:hypothetical protein